MGVFSNGRSRVTYYTVVCVAMSSAPKLQGLKIGCYPKGYAAPSDVPCQCNMRRSPSKLKRTLPQSKIYVTSKSPVGDISVVTLKKQILHLIIAKRPRRYGHHGYVEVCMLISSVITHCSELQPAGSHLPSSSWCHF